MGAKKEKEPTPPQDRPEPETQRDWGEPVNGLLALVCEKFPHVERKDAMLVVEPALVTTPEHIADLAYFLRSNEIQPFNYCRSVTGTDKIDRFEVVYNLANIPSPREKPADGFARIGVVVRISARENPETPSLINVWPGVDFQEREIWDLVGIKFKNHPDLRRILLDEEFIGHPLRKDYPLYGRWEDMMAIGAYLDEQQVKMMKEDAGEEFDPDDVKPNYKR